jgi:hypothetical protein
LQNVAKGEGSYRSVSEQRPAPLQVVSRQINSSRKVEARMSATSDMNVAGDDTYMPGVRRNA